MPELGSGRNLVERARLFAVSRHEVIGQRRKYTKAPYSEHLRHVADLVASVTDDEETLAAAWLHDVVEDTTTTLEDVENEFGKEVAGLVEALTDVSRPADGNRATRKAMDRDHIASADSRAKTVKLADLIGNCEDIARHDPGFAPVYLREMGALLEVLREGNCVLYEKAMQVYSRTSLNPVAQQEKPEDAPHLPRAWRSFPHHLAHLFLRGFRAQDIAEPLRSFDAERPCSEVFPLLQASSVAIIALRKNGVVCGYARTADLTHGACGDHLRSFRAGQVINQEDPLADVIQVLIKCEHAFLSAFGEIVGMISRNDVNKPVARMWLFGIIMLAEMELTRLLDVYYPEETWRKVISSGRLEKATVFHAERLRRQQPCRLVECLQFSDKAEILLEHPEGLNFFALESKRAGTKIIKEWECLRNDLAHGQNIATYDWAAIARIATRLSEAASLRRSE